jgi:hypothetical protein
VVESYSAKQDWGCPREGAEAGHIIIGYVQLCSRRYNVTRDRAGRDEM